MTRMEALEAARRLAPTALELFPGSDVYLFGSFAKGCDTVGSDIDFAVILPPDDATSPNEYFRKMGELSMAALAIDDRIEPVVRHRDDPTGFVATVVATGVRIA